MPRSRRELLQLTGTAIVSGLGGCTSQPSDGLATIDIGFDVQPLAVFSQDHPAQISISLTNASRNPFTIEGGGPRPFDNLNTHGELFLIPDNYENLVPTGENRENLDVPLVPTTLTDGCWTAGYHDIMWQEPAIIRRLAPNETFEEAYTLVDAPGGGCLPAPTYELRDTRTIIQGESRYQVVFSFTVVVSEGSLEIAVDDPDVGAPDSI